MESNLPPFLLRTDIQRLEKPLLIGISGDSGSGKTKFSNGIRELIGTDIVQTIEVDGYHKENREQRKLSGRLPLDPEANRLALLLEHMQSLKEWKSIDVPVYDHSSGEFTTPRPFKPSPIVIFEGLHVLYPQFLPYLDFSIYVDPSREVKWLWKKNRDTVDRGHDAKELENEMLKRESAYKRWIDFQKTSATIVVKIFPSQLSTLARYEMLEDLPAGCLKVELLVEPASKPLPSLILPLDLAMITDLHVPPFMLASVAGKYWGRDILDIHIDGELSVQTVSALEKHIESCTGVPVDSERNLDPVSTTKFTQLLIAWRFIELVHSKLP